MRVSHGDGPEFRSIAADELETSGHGDRERNDQCQQSDGRQRRPRGHGGNGGQGGAGGTGGVGTWSQPNGGPAKGGAGNAGLATGGSNGSPGAAGKQSGNDLAGTSTPITNYANQLVFVNRLQPPNPKNNVVTSAIGGDTPFNVAVWAENAKGLLDPSYTGDVTLSLGANNQGFGTSAASGTVSQAAGGIATFTDLSIIQAGTAAIYSTGSGNVGANTPTYQLTVDLTPYQIDTAYGGAALTAADSGADQTVAIIIPGDDPNLVSSSEASLYPASDLSKFIQQFGINSPGFTFTKIDQDGQVIMDRANGSPGTNAEPVYQGVYLTGPAMDVEWGHAIAPAANIVLVEYNNTNIGLAQAIVTAAGYAGVSVVSMSLGSPEYPGELVSANLDNENDSILSTPANHAPMTFIASTGDNGASGGNPAFSPNVVAVGGTTLTLSPASGLRANNFELSWNLTGGGVS